jgi:hypothetical protein
MATYYSDHFSTSAGATSVERNHRAVVAISHGRLRYKRAKLLFTPAADDIIRFFSMRSSDRLIELWLSSDDMGGAHTTHVGLYKAGANHDGAVIDADLFATSVDTGTAAIARTDVLNEAGNFTLPIGRGSALWELADAGAGTYTEDPQETWDVTATIATSATPAATDIVLEAYYTAGND